MTTRSTVKKSSTAGRANSSTASKPKLPAKPVVNKPVDDNSVAQQKVATRLPSRRVWPD